MKTQNNNFLNKLNSNEMVNLTKEVKETVATGIQHMNRVFSATDLWKIQSTKKTWATRRVFA